MSGPGLVSSLGEIFIALIVSSALWGLSCSQVSQYYTSQYSDPTWLRVMVVVVWVADTAHQALITQAFYQYAVTDFGQYLLLVNAPRSAAAQIVVSQFFVTLVQGFYAYKVWKLSQGTFLIRPRYVVTAACMLILAEIAMATADAVSIANSFTVFTLLANSHVWNIAYSVFACAIDVVLTGVMLYILHQNRTELSRTNGIINRVTALVLATNSLTALFSTAILVLTLTEPDSFAIIPLFHVDSRLYAVSFFAALNLREFLAHGGRAAPRSFAMSPFRVASRSSVDARPPTPKALAPWRADGDGLDSPRAGHTYFADHDAV